MSEPKNDAAPGAVLSTAGFDGLLLMARLEGRLEAYAKAMTECTKSAQREGGSVGGRNCMEIREAIDIMHLHTLRELYPVAYKTPNGLAQAGGT